MNRDGPLGGREKEGEERQREKGRERERRKGERKREGEVGRGREESIHKVEVNRTELTQNPVNLLNHDNIKSYHTCNKEVYCIIIYMYYTQAQISV